MTSIDVDSMNQDDWVLAPHVFTQNVVATWKTGMPFCDIARLASDDMGQYDPEKFAAAIFRLKKPENTNLFFSTGNCVTAGSKSEHEALLSAHIQATYFQERNLAIAVKCFKIENIVCSTYTDFGINLSLLYNEIQSNYVCNYDPENFPGLILRYNISSYFIYYF